MIRFEWCCELESDSINSLKLIFIKSNQNWEQLHYLNDSRISLYINLVRLISVENKEIKLGIIQKKFQETEQNFQFDLIVNFLGQNLDQKSYKAFLMVDRSMFNMMHYAVDNANKIFLFPKVQNYNIEIQEDLDITQDEKDFPAELTPKQKAIIKRILSVKTDQLTPPMVVFGAFGTGKSKCLAIAAERLSQQSALNKVLICTYSQSAVDAFFDNWDESTNSKAICLVKYICKETSNRKYTILSVTDVKLKAKISEARLVVCTFYVSILLNENSKMPGWFTHILIDESAYALEPEVIMPITLATSNTSVILVGDHKQIRPSILNKENIDFLASNWNLLERLLYQFKSCFKDKKKLAFRLDNYFLTLNEVHRTVKEIVDFVSANFYQRTLIAHRMNADYSNLKGYYPIQFVNSNSKNSEEYVSIFCSYENKCESMQIVELVQKLITNWPNSWDNISIGIICNQNAQINCLTELLKKNDLLRKNLSNKSIIVNTIQQMQGLQFRVTLISTVFTQLKTIEQIQEHVLQNYVLSPFACNTCITRCEELLFVFGNSHFFYNEIPECFYRFSMRSFWKQLISLCKHKSSFYESISQIPYIQELKSKILKNKKPKSKKFSNNIYVNPQFGDDFILNEYIGINQMKNEEPNIESLPYEAIIEEDTEDETDEPLSRSKMKNKIKPNFNIFGKNLKQFNFEKSNTTRKRHLLTAQDAYSDVEDLNEIDEDTLYNLISNNEDSDDFTVNNQRSYYDKYVNKSIAWELVNNHSNRYKRCRIECVKNDEALAYSIDDNSVYRLNSRYDCGPTYLGDEVAVELSEDKQYGTVICVLKRSQPVKYRQFVCEPDEFEPYSLMKPLDKMFPKIYLMPKSKNKMLVYELNTNKDEAQFKNTYMIEDIFNLNSKMYLVVLLDWKPWRKYPFGVITEIISPALDMDNCLKLMNLMYDLKDTYAEWLTPDQFNNYKTDCEARLMIQSKTNKRLDLTDHPLTFTIDPENSRDLDDAISFEKISTANKIEYFKIGIHIADVSEWIAKSDKIDSEAARRALTFYILSKSYVSMLPDKLCHDWISLLPGKKRACLSVLFLMNKNADVIQDIDLLEKAKIVANFEGKYQIVNTLIKSKHRLSYLEAELEINQSSNKEKSLLADELTVLFELSEKLKEKRFKKGYLYINDSSTLTEYKSHSLIEQFMIFANSVMADFLTKNNSNMAPIRIQSQPDIDYLNDWMERSNSLRQLSFGVERYFQCMKSIKQNNMLYEKSEPHISTSKFIYNKIENLCKSLSEFSDRTIPPNLDKLEFLVRNETNYPVFAVKISSLKNVMQRARYTSESGLYGIPSHFDLNLNSHYTHFTSPIRRYFDVVVHRMIKAILNESEPVYNKNELEIICSNCNLKSTNQKKFDKHISVLNLAQHLKITPFRCLAFLEAIDETELHLMYPSISILNSDENLLSLKYSNLSLIKQPFISHETKEKENKLVKLNWALKILDAQNSNSAEIKTSSRSNLKIDLQSLFSCKIPIDWWRGVHNAIETNNKKDLIQQAKIFNSIKNLNEKSVQHDISSNQSVFNDKQKFHSEFKLNDLISVQLYAEEKKGFLVPAIQLITITKSIDFCIEHKNNYMKCFNARATKPVKDPSKKYADFSEYLEIWLPLILMETTASSILNTEENLLVRNIKVEWFEREACHPITNIYEKFTFGVAKFQRDNFDIDFFDLVENNFAASSSNNK